MNYELLINDLRGLLESEHFDAKHGICINLRKIGYQEGQYQWLKNSFISLGLHKTYPVEYQSNPNYFDANKEFCKYEDKWDIETNPYAESRHELLDLLIEKAVSDQKTYELLNLILSGLIQIQKEPVRIGRGICENLKITLGIHGFLTVHDNWLTSKFEKFGLHFAFPVEGCSSEYHRYVDKWNIVDNPYAGERHKLLARLIDEAQQDIIKMNRGESV
ncbi:hypothetical protein POP12_023 [Pectobacterium phage POP12]|nr:hypothetical protein POP12_023 [Pectobacterium phage POP12]